MAPTELMENLEEPNLIVIDSRSYKEYSEGHIPRAVNLDLFYYHWSDTSKEGIKAFDETLMIQRELLEGFSSLSNLDREPIINFLKKVA